MKPFQFRSLLRTSLAALFAVNLLTQAGQAAPDTLYQVSTLQTLSQGHFDSLISFKNLRKQGDFGVGALDKLDGELIFLDGKGWQARYDGKVVQVPDKARLPFAVVTHFRPQLKATVASRTEYPALVKQLDDLLPTRNAPVAIKVHGRFTVLRARSVERQERPYSTLAEAVKRQVEWEWKEIDGTMVGFRFPQFLSGVNLADYHFHFISDDKTRGGHVLNAVIRNATIELSVLRNFEMLLPSSEEFDRRNLD